MTDWQLHPDQKPFPLDALIRMAIDVMRLRLKYGLPPSRDISDLEDDFRLIHDDTGDVSLEQSLSLLDWD